MGAMYEHGVDHALELLGIKTAADDSTIKRYGIPTALGLGATGALYALLRKQRLSADPILRAIQKASGGKLTALDYSARSPALAEAIGAKHPHAWMPDWLRKMMIKVTRGADDVRLHRLTHEELPGRADELRQLLRGQKLKPATAVEEIEGALINQGEPWLHRGYRGSVNPTGDIQDAMRIGWDKQREAEFLQKYMPGVGPTPFGTVEDYLTKGMRRRGTEAQTAALQRALLKKRPEGFIIKPRAGAATGDIIRSTDDLTQLLTDPGQKGRWVRDMLENPQSYVVQEHLPIATERRLPFIGGKHHPGQAQLPVEYRVHVVGGRIVPGAISRRYGTVGSLNPLKTRREKQELIRQLQPHLEKLPAQTRQEMLLGMDVVRTPGGQFRVIETNPMGGQSGFLQPDVTHAPTLAPHRVYKAITGRESKPLAAAKALAGGGAAAGLGYAATQN
jgi:hypothetical protein